MHLFIILDILYREFKYYKIRKKIDKLTKNKKKLLQIIKYL